jgi:hypothetical protein
LAALPVDPQQMLERLHPIGQQFLAGVRASIGQNVLQCANIQYSQTSPLVVLKIALPGSFPFVVIAA